MEALCRLAYFLKLHELYIQWEIDELYIQWEIDELYIQWELLI